MVTTGMSAMNSGPGNGSEERTDQPGSVHANFASSTALTLKEKTREMSDTPLLFLADQI